MNRPTSKTAHPPLRHAESLAALWYAWKNNAYAVASNFMQDMPVGWNGFQAVTGPDSQTTSVFREWLNTAQEMFDEYNQYRGILSEEGQKQKRVLMEDVKRDVAWWKANQGDPQADAKALWVLLQPFDRRSSFNLGYELLEEWADTCLDTDWLADPSLLGRFAIQAAEASAAKTLRRLVRAHGVDVNQECWTKTEADDSEWGFGRDYNKKHKARTNMRKLGYFVRTLETAKALTELGFDWNAKDSTGQSSLELLQSQGNDHFVSIEARSEVMKYLSKLRMQNKSENPQEVVWGLLKKAKKQEDVAIAVSGVKWQDLRGPNGENFMHALAMFAPTSLKKYATSKAGLVLMSEKDALGRTPLEYAFGFGESEVVARSLEGWAEIRERNRLQKADWLEAKRLAFENRVPSSVVSLPSTKEKQYGVQSVNGNEWVQQTNKDFKDALSSPKGQLFLEDVAKNYGKPNRDSAVRWRNSPDNKLYLDRWVGGPKDFAFLKSAKTKPEVQVALWEAWNELASFPPYNDSKAEKQALAKHTEQLTEKAIEMDIDVGQMKRDVMSGKADLSGKNKNDFDATMEDLVPGWTSLESRVQRRLLMKRVDGKGVKVTHKMEGAL